MLQIEECIDDLHHYLLRTGLYEGEERAADETNAQVLQMWKTRFESALKADFFRQLQLNIFLSNCHFNLLSDQGAAVWTNKITIVDETAPEKLGIWLRAIVNHRLIKIRLEEMSIRRSNYSGRSATAKTLFDQLMAAQKNGYSSELSIGECLSFQL